MNQNRSKKSSAHRLIAICGVVIACCTIFGCIGCLGIVFFGDGLSFGSSNTEADYPTNQARLDYLNQVLPFTLPANTKVMRFRLEGFQDWFLDADLRIPPADIKAFLDNIPGLESGLPDQYEAQFGPDQLDLDINPDTGDIHLEYIEA